MRVAISARPKSQVRVQKHGSRAGGQNRTLFWVKYLWLACHADKNHFFFEEDPLSIEMVEALVAAGIVEPQL